MKKNIPYSVVLWIPLLLFNTLLSCTNATQVLTMGDRHAREKIEEEKTELACQQRLARLPLSLQGMVADGICTIHEAENRFLVTNQNSKSLPLLLVVGSIFVVIILPSWAYMVYSNYFSQNNQSPTWPACLNASLLNTTSNIG
ncbi:MULTISPECIES: hypothetical protein [unclassified Candidatus Cardinium]|uniref:hypothetical protein n=1 Tax=unclassified Candidatus Cardinium TaxID=2641185 RepID=UPI001FB44A72|nr:MULTISPECIES: hypothetical protein [unclassified Candidatus Cardinium]